MHRIWQPARHAAGIRAPRSKGGAVKRRHLLRAAQGSDCCDVEHETSGCDKHPRYLPKRDYGEQAGDPLPEVWGLRPFLGAALGAFFAGAAFFVSMFATSLAS